MLDSARLRGDLAHIHKALTGVVTGSSGGGLLDDLRAEGSPVAVLLQALHADCLRVVHTAVTADGIVHDDEVIALSEFIFVTSRHYAELVSGYREFAATDGASVRRFLEHYAMDGGVFGARATRHWPGLTLCRRAAQLGEIEAFERYERMMSWLIPASCEIGGVIEGDPRWASRVAELHGLRRTLAQEATKVTRPAVDKRLQAFLARNDVFASTQQPVSMFEDDPFDVEEVHHDARVAFEQLVDRAASPEQHATRNRILLMLGGSGAGKTHLLRGFVRHVQRRGRGLVAYAQMHSAAEDYARYLLHHVVDALSRPYRGTPGSSTGLLELATGLSTLVADPARSEILRIAEGDWDPEESLHDVVFRLADELRKVPVLAGFHADLLRVLLFALAPDEVTTAQAYQYLRCEDMNAHDRRWLGDVIPRTRAEHPIQMIRDLARLAYLGRSGVLVLMVDQAELSGSDAILGGKMFTRAVDTLYSIVSEVPSAVAVVACLSDVYAKVRRQLNNSMIDRLEQDPPMERLREQRSFEEIETIVRRRLECLFEQAGATFRPEEPTYPISTAILRALTNRRMRDVLQWCDRFQRRCEAAKQLVDPNEPREFEQSGADGVNAGSADLAPIAAAWNDACHTSGIEVPKSSEAIASAVLTAAKACADELGLSLTVASHTKQMLRLRLSGATARADLAIAITNHGFQRGAFGTQIEALCRSADGATPVAVRTLEFPRGRACEEAIGKLVRDGGRRVYIDASTLRTLAAFQIFRPAFPEARVVAWRRRDRPISTLPAMADLFDLERLCATPTLEVGPARVAAITPPAGTLVVSEVETAVPAQPVAQTPRAGGPAVDTAPGPAGKSAPASHVGSTNGAPAGSKRAARARRDPKPSTEIEASTNGHAAAHLLVGASASFGAEPRSIEVRSLLRHTGILGSSGSGKTTLALNLVEQVLERDVAVVLVDRKGDLAGYAKPDWWQHAADRERARRLAERVDVRLFTPGTRGGRPLSLSVVPDLQQIPDHERERMIQYAANALAAIMNLGSGAADNACRAILAQAIAVLAERNQPCGLPELLELLETRDDRLLARAGRYDDKRFRKLVEDLETVRLNDADLFDAAAEPLTAETLIGRKPGEKVPLAVVSTRFLGEVDRIQSWVAHLIACLNRYAARSPNAELRLLFMIDEADVFMPAGASKPPSKEPLQDLLKRARAAGLGIVLASQSPADFDYRSREQINTWFLGRIADQRSVDKMKPLFEHRPAVGGKLGTQDAGRFVMLQDGEASDLSRTPSLLRTEQIAEVELMSLAARTRDRG